MKTEQVTECEGVVLFLKYRAFIWTGDEHQIHNPVWFNEYLESEKAWLMNIGFPGLFISHLGRGGDINKGDVVVQDGLGLVNRYSNDEFKTIFGIDTYDKLRGIE